MGLMIKGERVATTQAGDGYERRAFSAAESYKLQDLGIIDDDEGFELIEGDIVMMQSKNAPHERIKAPVDGAWTSIEVRSTDATLRHPSAPGFAIRLADL